MRIFGIDPGLRSMGWGVIDYTPARMTHVASGEIKPKGASLSHRLVELFNELRALLETYAPEAAAVEETFVNTNAASTLKLGQARGVALLAPALIGIDVGEYAANTIKKTVVGVGHAQKSQVAHMVGMQLPGAKVSGHDAFDALAIAICHGVHLHLATNRPSPTKRARVTP